METNDWDAMAATDRSVWPQSGAFIESEPSGVEESLKIILKFTALRASCASQLPLHAKQRNFCQPSELLPTQLSEMEPKKVVACRSSFKVR
ncbi:hypothetical protein M514_08283 [Trichuris suis]|uniref:Uncharacterized protein n=1 Tax=Trichuris suis TaxID=68888 RepID=A0A085NHH9_9BILA|nr:hypothetical protein M513_08283 [Trichuris suis]KFD68925.1 hypothetical protein M514_08283 [Trichuris suis]